MGATIKTLLDRFPELKAPILRLMRKSQRFRDICVDYAEAVVLLKTWEQQDDPESRARAEECRRLLTDLEIEILDEIARE